MIDTILPGVARAVALLAIACTVVVGGAGSAAARGKGPHSRLNSRSSWASTERSTAPKNKVGRAASAVSSIATAPVRLLDSFLFPDRPIISGRRPETDTREVDDASSTAAAPVRDASAPGPAFPVPDVSPPPAPAPDSVLTWSEPSATESEDASTAVQSADELASEASDAVTSMGRALPWLGGALVVYFLLRSVRGVQNLIVEVHRQADAAAPPPQDVSQGRDQQHSEPDATSATATPSGGPCFVVRGIGTAVADGQQLLNGQPAAGATAAAASTAADPATSVPSAVAAKEPNQPSSAGDAAQAVAAPAQTHGAQLPPAAAAAAAQHIGSGESGNMAAAGPKAAAAPSGDPTDGWIWQLHPMAQEADEERPSGDGYDVSSATAKDSAGSMPDAAARLDAEAKLESACKEVALDVANAGRAAAACTESGMELVITSAGEVTHAVAHVAEVAMHGRAPDTQPAAPAYESAAATATNVAAAGMPALDDEDGDAQWVGTEPDADTWEAADVNAIAAPAVAEHQEDLSEPPAAPAGDAASETEDAVAAAPREEEDEYAELLRLWREEDGEFAKVLQRWRAKFAARDTAAPATAAEAAKEVAASDSDAQAAAGAATSSVAARNWLADVVEQLEAQAAEDSYEDSDDNDDEEEEAVSDDDGGVEDATDQDDDLEASYGEEDDQYEVYASFDEQDEELEDSDDDTDADQDEDLEASYEEQEDEYEVHASWDEQDEDDSFGDESEEYGDLEAMYQEEEYDYLEAKASWDEPDEEEEDSDVDYSDDENADEVCATHDAPERGHGATPSYSRLDAQLREVDEKRSVADRNADHGMLALAALEVLEALEAKRQRQPEQPAPRANAAREAPVAQTAVDAGPPVTDVRAAAAQTVAAAVAKVTGGTAAAVGRAAAQRREAAAPPPPPATDQAQVRDVHVAASGEGPVDVPVTVEAAGQQQQQQQQQQQHVQSVTRLIPVEAVDDDAVAEPLTGEPATNEAQAQAAAAVAAVASHAAGRAAAAVRRAAGLRREAAVTSPLAAEQAQRPAVREVPVAASGDGPVDVPVTVKDVGQQQQQRSVTREILVEAIGDAVEVVPVIGAPAVGRAQAQAAAAVAAVASRAAGRAVRRAAGLRREAADMPSPPTEQAQPPAVREVHVAASDDGPVDVPVAIQAAAQQQQQQHQHQVQSVTREVPVEAVGNGAAAAPVAGAPAVREAQAQAAAAVAAVASNATGRAAAAVGRAAGLRHNSLGKPAAMSGDEVDQVARELDDGKVHADVDADMDTSATALEDVEPVLNPQHGDTPDPRTRVNPQLERMRHTAANNKRFSTGFRAAPAGGGAVRPAAAGLPRWKDPATVQKGALPGDAAYLAEGWFLHKQQTGGALATARGGDIATAGGGDIVPDFWQQAVPVRRNGGGAVGASTATATAAIDGDPISAGNEHTEPPAAAAAAAAAEAAEAPRPLPPVRLTVTEMQHDLQVMIKNLAPVSGAGDALLTELVQYWKDDAVMAMKLRSEPSLPQLHNDLTTRYKAIMRQYGTQRARLLRERASHRPPSAVFKQGRVWLPAYPPEPEGGDAAEAGPQAAPAGPDDGNAAEAAATDAAGADGVEGGKQDPRGDGAGHAAKAEVVPEGVRRADVASIWEGGDVAGAAAKVGATAVEAESAAAAAVVAAAAKAKADVAATAAAATVGAAAAAAAMELEAAAWAGWAAAAVDGEEDAGRLTVDEMRHDVQRMMNRLAHVSGDIDSMLTELVKEWKGDAIMAVKPRSGPSLPQVHEDLTRRYKAIMRRRAETEMQEEQQQQQPVAYAKRGHKWVPVFGPPKAVVSSKAAAPPAAAAAGATAADAKADAGAGRQPGAVWKAGDGWVPLPLPTATSADAAAKYGSTGVATQPGQHGDAAKAGEVQQEREQEQGADGNGGHAARATTGANAPQELAEERVDAPGAGTAAAAHASSKAAGSVREIPIEHMGGAGVALGSTGVASVPKVPGSRDAGSVRDIPIECVGGAGFGTDASNTAAADVVRDVPVQHGAALGPTARAPAPGINAARSKAASSVRDIAMQIMNGAASAPNTTSTNTAGDSARHVPVERLDAAPVAATGPAVSSKGADGVREIAIEDMKSADAASDTSNKAVGDRAREVPVERTDGAPLQSAGSGRNIKAACSSLESTGSESDDDSLLDRLWPTADGQFDIGASRSAAELQRRFGSGDDRRRTAGGRSGGGRPGSGRRGRMSDELAKRQQERTRWRMKQSGRGSE